ncbi:endoplasmic reticulum lectin 1-like isoform X2 [Panulirus ornatus]|uniref:endoplasmic reticulum lectin 1-like isoform X2 n=1 Tax=Panulirus ornatus TaxID=150431 RepID=UPI003A8B1855
MATKSLVLVLLSAAGVTNIFAANQIKGLDDAILFRINWPGADTNLLESPDYEKLVMTSSNNEQYQCLIPINYGGKNDESEVYRGPSALTLLMPLFKKQSCNLRLESYWTYELCHGIHLKQYREEREGKNARLHEYILGLFSTESLSMLNDKVEADFKEKLNSDIPTTKIEGRDMPYFMLNYTDGTICDLTGKPRISHILYVCYEEGRHDIYSIKETYTCEYEIIVLSPYLCQHPSYRPRDLPQTGLHCVPMSGNPKRPRNLIQTEAESLKLRSSGAVLAGDTSSGSVKLEVVEDAEEPPVASVTPEPLAKLSLFPPQPAIDQKLVQDFLNGDYCLHGNPEKVYKPGKRHVSHFYSKGTTCDLTGKPRQVEVKLKCKESNSPSSVTLYLLEPETCEYTLGVETSIICPLLQHADDLGLFTVASGADHPQDTTEPPTIRLEIVHHQPSQQSLAKKEDIEGEKVKDESKEDTEEDRNQ